MGNWHVDPQLDEISHDDKVIKLEPRMVRLLVKLAETPGQVVSTQQLLDTVWNGVVVGPASVYQAVSQLRKQLGDTDPKPIYIATVLRKGYRLVAPVAPEPVNAGGNLPVTTPPEVRRPPNRWRWGLLAGLLALVAALGLFALRTAPMPRSTATVLPAPKLPAIFIAPFHAEGSDEDSRRFTLSARLLLRDRLETQSGILLMADASAYLLGKKGLDVREFARKIGADYVLSGSASRAADKLHLKVALLDVTSGKHLWSITFDRVPGELATIREDLVQKIGKTLRIQFSDSGNFPIDFEAFELYTRAVEAWFLQTGAGNKEANALFARTTMLDPTFARAYYGLGTTSYWAGSIEDAASALDRALELDPKLGDALVVRADMVAEVDPVKAEEMFRRALKMSPNSQSSYSLYAPFLVSRGRYGEAIALVAQARRIDPVSEFLAIQQAGLVVMARSDVAEHERLLREALELHPGSPWVLTALGSSRYYWSGATADSIRILEQQITYDPQDWRARRLAAAAYLDVDDPAAARDVADGDPVDQVEIAQYLREPAHASQLPDDEKTWGWGEWFQCACSPTPSNALRDEAIASGNYAPVLKLFETLRPKFEGANPMVGQGVLSVYAHTLVLSGDTQGGRKLATTLLEMIGHEDVGRNKFFFARGRAAAYAVLGNYERALDELAQSQQFPDFTRWWYTAELDPLFAPLRKDPRFQRLAEAAKKHRAEQRVLLEEMRRKGEVPRRPS